MKVTLVFPPNRNIPAAPYGALPLLAGCLRASGHDVEIVDANLEVFERLLDRGLVDRIGKEIDAAWRRLEQRDRVSRTEIEALSSISMISLSDLERIEAAGDTLRDPRRFVVPADLNVAYERIADLLRTAFCQNPLFNPLKTGGVAELFDYVDGKPSNMISELVADVVIPRILATGPDLVGVCIPFNEQLPEGFVLLAQLKRCAPGLPTVAGGAIISGYADALCADPRFFNVADFAMPGEADDALPRLCRALNDGDDLDEVPNLFWRDEEGRVHRPRHWSLPDLNRLPAPDFSAIPVDRYFLPEPVINYQTSRGCYYGKCTFCSADIKNNFRFRRGDLVAADLEHIQAQTGARHVVFWDPLTPLRVMRDVALWNQDRGSKKIYWGAETKFEKYFTRPDVAELLYNGGARFLQLGFESGSQRLLDLMRKGNDLEQVDVMLETLGRAGIAISVQWFIGFPTETPEEARASFRYLEDRRQSVLLSSYMGMYSISPGDDVFESNGDLYDIDLFQLPDGQYDYRHRNGTSRYERDELHAAYLARGDADTVTRMAFFVYLTRCPENVREITGFKRGGPLPECWKEVADCRLRLPGANVVRSFPMDRDMQRDDTEQSSLNLARVARSEHMERLTNEELRMVHLVDGNRTAREIVQGVPGAPRNLRERLLHLVRCGLLVSVPRVDGPVAGPPDASTATVIASMTD